MVEAKLTSFAMNDNKEYHGCFIKQYDTWIINVSIAQYLTNWILWNHSLWKSLPKTGCKSHQYNTTVIIT